MTLNITTVKQAFALAAAWGVGLWSGINYTASIANTTYRLQPPEWVGTAESMAYSSVAVVALAVVAWMYVDYCYGGASE